MILKGLKRKSNQLFLNKNKTKLFAKMNSNSNFESSEKIKSILILLDNDSDKKRIVESLRIIFNIEETDISVLIFQKKATKNSNDISLISQKDFGWKGSIKSDFLKSILTKNFDLLINYRKVDNSYINLVILLSKSKFRIGFKHLNNQFYQLLIKCEHSDIELFNNEIKKYLQILKKI